MRLCKGIWLGILLCFVGTLQAQPSDSALPKHAVARLGSLRFGHAGAIHSLAYSPDGTKLATGGYDATVRVWESGTGKEIYRLEGHTGTVKPILFSADGKTLISAAADRTIRLWDLTTGKEVRRLQSGHGIAAALQISPDGKTLAAGCEDRLIHLWDLATGNEIQQFLGHTNLITALAFSSSGKQLFSAGSESFVRVWEVATGKEEKQLPTTTICFAVASSSTGELTVSGGSDGALRYWAPDSVQAKRVVNTLPGVVSQVSFSKDGKKVLCVGSDKCVYVRDAEKDDSVLKLGPFPLLIHAVSLSPDGKTLATAHDYESSPRFWDVATGKEKDAPTSHRGYIRGLHFLADGKTLLSGSSEGSIMLWDLPTGKEKLQLSGHKGMLSALAVSPDGKFALSHGAGEEAARIFALPEGNEVKALGKTLVSTSWFQPAAWSGDGKFILSGMTSTIRYFDIETGQVTRNLSSGTLGSLAVSPDGKLLAVGIGTTYATPQPGTAVTTGLSMLRLYDAVNATVLPTQFTGHSNNVTSLVFSPDGKSLASWSGDRSVRLWEVATGKSRRVFYIGPPTGTIGFGVVAFSHDGKYLAASHYDRSVRIWDTFTGREVANLVGHQGWVRALAFSQDGKTLASGADESVIYLWDLNKLLPKADPAEKERSANDLKKAWQELQSDDSIVGYRALVNLADTPMQTVSLIRDNLGTITDLGEVNRLLTLLDDNDFSVREKASLDLQQLGPAAEPTLRAKLREECSTELRTRILKLLGKLGKEQGGGLRLIRTIELLERLASSDAVQLLDGLAKGAPGSLSTDLARDALARLRRRI